MEKITSKSLKILLYSAILYLGGCNNISCPTTDDSKFVEQASQLDIEKIRHAIGTLIIEEGDTINQVSSFCIGRAKKNSEKYAIFCTTTHNIVGSMDNISLETIERTPYKFVKGRNYPLLHDGVAFFLVEDKNNFWQPLKIKGNNVSYDYHSIFRGQSMCDNKVNKVDSMIQYSDYCRISAKDTWTRHAGSGFSGSPILTDSFEVSGILVGHLVDPITEDTVSIATTTKDIRDKLSLYLIELESEDYSIDGIKLEPTKPTEFRNPSRFPDVPSEMEPILLY